MFTISKTASVWPDLLSFQGIFNFRDMGGVKTVDGRIVRKGILFRSAELTGLTESDLFRLERMALKRIFDYRSRFEAEAKPDPTIGQASNERIPATLEEASNPIAPRAAGSFFKQITREIFKEMYAGMPLQNASYQRLMALVKEPERNLPLLHHCTGGRDRTGVGSMLILLTLGVSYEYVLEDYLFSNHALEDYHRHIVNEALKYVGEEGLDRFKDAFFLQEEYLQASMDSITARYGSFDRYLLEEYEITPEIRARIQDFCLE